MLQHVRTRLAHHLLLLLTTAALCLPNLGAPSLWDIDEGNNATAAFEMLESGNWVIPTFNGELRVDKPALLYWLQILAYQQFGVNEFSARLPSALAALVAVLLAYELGRRLFGPTAGLLAGLALGGSVAVCAAAHFANPDSLLNACTVAAFLFFWLNAERPRAIWFAGFGAATGLAVLAKGPVGLVLPMAATTLFAFLGGRRDLLVDRRQGLAVLAFVLVAVPWYAWVGAETKGEFLWGFFLKHNWERATRPMENHSGTPLYYLPVLLVGFLPWSVFLGPTVWHSARQWRGAPAERSKHLYLWCWVTVYLLPFSLSATKLPNYILPLYAPLALLTAATLDAWRRGEFDPPRWAFAASLSALALAGLGVSAAGLLAGGVLPVPALRTTFAGMEARAALGLLLLLGAVLGAASWWKGRRTAMLGSVAATGLAFVGGAAAWGCLPLEAHKVPRTLAALVRADQQTQTERDVGVGCYGWFQPSLVFYCGRDVRVLKSESVLREYLRTPLPVYVFVTAEDWEKLTPTLATECRLLGRRHDFYRNRDVVVVTNR